MGYNRGGRGGRQSYDNNLQGVLFENTQKRRGKQDPDMRGQVEIEGVKYWISAWWNQHDQKGDYIKMALQVQEEESPQQRNTRRTAGYQDQQPQRGAPPRRSGGYQNNAPPDDDLDDIPF